MNPRQRRQVKATARLLASIRFQITDHAVLRARELGYSMDEIVRCVRAPEQCYPGGPDHPAGRRVLQRHDLAVVVDDDSLEVVTVLLRTDKDWMHGVDNRRSLTGAGRRRTRTAQ